MADRGSAYRFDHVSYRSTADEISEAEETPVLPDEKPHIDMNVTETKSGSVFSIILVSVLAAALLGTVIYSFDRRNTMYSKVSELNNELTLAEAENVRLQSELEGKLSAKNVEEFAEKTLGMQKIDSSQIKYIEIQTDDVVNIPQQDKGILAKVKGFFEKCVEYFRG